MAQENSFYFVIPLKLQMGGNQMMADIFLEQNWPLKLL